MRDTKLILVEGLPGLGKTTTASWLAAHLRARHLPARLYLESQPGHPLNVGGDAHPAGDTTGDALFQRYTPLSYMQESLERWQIFVRAASGTDTITVLDSYPYQNSARILLQLNADLDAIHAYAGQVEQITAPLRPVLIYLCHAEGAQTALHFTAISEQRGVQWAAYVAALISRCPYAEARNLSGADGVMAFMSDYQQLVEALLRESRLPRLVLESCYDHWESCYQRIEAYLA